MAKKQHMGEEKMPAIDTEIDEPIKLKCVNARMCVSYLLVYHTHFDRISVYAMTNEPHQYKPF